MAKPGRLVAIGGLLVGVFVVAILGGILGRSLGRSEYTVSYADFISILLTAVSLLITLLGFILAILAFIGWNSISSKVETDVEVYLGDGFKDGNSLHVMFVKELKALAPGVLKSAAPNVMFEGVSPVDAEFDADAQAEDAEAGNG